jgi:hypothetical protein
MPDNYLNLILEKIKTDPNKIKRNKDKMKRI